MNILVVGGGGREHAIIKAIRNNPKVKRIYALPGNGGIESDAICVNIPATAIQDIAAFAADVKIDFAIVAPDDPLVLGCVDALKKRGIPCFGPNKRAAAIEGSKAFAKNMMKRFGIPTADYRVFISPDAAEKYLSKAKYPLVIKADGLALGKGVLICQTREQGIQAVSQIMTQRQFGDSGKKIVVEQFLTGPEVSVLCFTDGVTLAPLVSSMDHKRALDGDMGLNTGGMGVVAPNPFYTQDIAKRCMDEIFLPTMRAMNELGRTFRGLLYFGLMLSEDGPKVIEYNCRFGDPETQAVLPLLETDLLEIMLAVSETRLSDLPVINRSGACCCVMVVSGGYPGAYAKGLPIEIGDIPEGATLYHSGTALSENGALLTSGGRVIGASARGATLAEAVETAYKAAKQVRFADAYMRSDIGAKALSIAE